MGLVTIKKLDDIKKLKVGEKLPIEDFADPELGYLELKGFGYVNKDGSIEEEDGKTYQATLVVEDVYLNEIEGYAEIEVEVQLSEDNPQHGAIGTLQCIVEED